MLQARSSDVNPLSACITRRPVLPAVVVLAIPQARDREYLRQFLHTNRISAVEALTYREVLNVVGRYGASLLLIDETLEWRELLGYLSEALYPPLVVVVAASPATHLYGEVLNHGGDYVLAKPFIHSEIEWLINLVVSTPESQPIRNKPAIVREEPQLLSAGHW
jgi:DNA-binding response OmpR family regulator